MTTENHDRDTATAHARANASVLLSATITHPAATPGTRLSCIAARDALQAPNVISDFGLRSGPGFGSDHDPHSTRLDPTRLDPTRLGPARVDAAYGDSVADLITGALTLLAALPAEQFADPRIRSACRFGRRALRDCT